MRVFSARLAVASLLLVTAFACSKNDDKASPDGGPDDGGAVPDTSTPPDGDAATPVDGAAPPPDAWVTMTTETMEFDGKTRRYLLGLPKDYDGSKSYPLVLNFHGNPGTAEGELAYLPFQNVSKVNAVVAYPQGTDNDWDLYTPTESNADMNWIHALPGEIANKANIDPSRIFGFGFSGGGFFLAQFTCRFGDVFKAVSINSGGGPDEPQMGYDKYDNGCYQCPGGPVATLVVHGDSDPVVDPGSGAFTQACFATFNQCGDATSDVTPSPCVQYDGCPADKPVKWCLVPGLGHAAWNQALSESWSFFQALP